MGNGPEALQQVVLGAVLLAVFVPPIRHWFERHIKSLHDKLDHQHQERIDQAAHHHKEALALARKNHAEHMVALESKSNRDSKGRFIK